MLVWQLMMSSNCSSKAAAFWGCQHVHGWPTRMSKLHHTNVVEL
jgi:hypothetical protein